MNPITQPKAIILFTPALGIRGSYYKALPDFFAQHGYLLVINELRGTNGDSPGRSFDFGYNELVNVDIKNQVEQLRDTHPHTPIFLAGNSLGGQLSILFAANYPEVIAGLILIGVGSPCWKYFPLQRQLAIKSSVVLIPLTGALLGYFPGQLLGFGGREAKTMMKDWGHLAQTDTFAIANDGFDYEAAIPRITLPVLSVGYSADDMAPPAAVDGLLKKLRNASINKIMIKGFGHTQWAKDPANSLADVVAWLEQRLPV